MIYNKNNENIIIKYYNFNDHIFRNGSEESFNQ